MSKRETVVQIIVEQLGVDALEVTENAHFLDDLGADSLEHVELIMAIEDDLDIIIDDKIADTLQTVKALVDYVELVTKGEKG